MDCASCCIRCRSEGAQPTSSTAQDPFNLNNLLKAGVVSVQLGRDPQPELYCEHRHESDGWHPYLGATPFLPLTNLNDVNLCKALEFLVKHRFTAVTYRVQGARVIFRVYLLPYDLAGAKGALRVRQETILAPAKRFLRDVLPKVDKSASSWEGKKGEGPPLLPHRQDPRTLAEIYSDLGSPNAVPVPGLGNISQRLLNYEDPLDGLGLRSKLYRYQRRSVAAMLHHELDPQDIPDPLFIPLTTVDGQTFFFQPGTMEVLQECPQVAPCRGGILCEELGTGKTVMIISLILATLRQLPAPEESLVDDRPVMTPLSFRHFPSSGCETARKRMPYKSKGKERECRVPTFVELLIDRSRTSPCEDVPDFTTELGRTRTEGIMSIEDKFENLPLDDLRKETVPFYFHYVGDPTNSDRDSRRKRSSEAPKRMYLSPATLVVVPPNLLGQWDREVIKHSEHPLRVLILRDRSDMPSVKALCSDYDIVLMTYTRFTQESKQTTASLHTLSPCKCPPIPGSRVPLCICTSTSVSPLLQIRWKRLVIDEGHVSASVSTDLAPCTKAMSIERRWIVTGTPTTNLLGLGLGARTVTEDLEEESDAMEGVEEGAGHDTYLLNVPELPAIVPPSAISRNLSTMSIDTPLSSSVSSSRHSTPFSPADDRPTKAREWDSDDRGDLRKLGNMITHFIAVPQFAADAKLMGTHVTDALVNGGAGGPRPGAIQVLNQVMGTVMVRHRVEDIEDDVALPPLTYESVMLDLDPFAIKSYNALQASIVVNAIDSERKDLDYLFHPANADLLQVTIKNMSQIMFWSTDDKRYYVDQIYREGKVHMDRAIARNRPPEDIALLKDALRHIEIAATDTSWSLVHSHEDVPYRVYGLDSKVYDAWTRIPGNSDPSLPSSFSGFLSADRLLKLYDLALTKPLTTPDSITLLGQQVSAEDSRLRELYIDSQEKKGKGRKSKAKERKLENVGNEISGSHSQIVAATVKRASARETMEEVRTELKESIAQLEEELERQDLLGAAEPGDGNTRPSGSSTGATGGKVAVLTASKVNAHAPKKLSVLAHNSLLAKVRIGSSASNKLNYIINEVLKYSAKEKILIFTDSELTLAHVAEAMDLIHVKYLRFSTQIPPRHREQLVLTFETSETYRVFLMELKHGARGLNLVSASRVIFCEPVWQADVESQAIKRVHRIGQTRPINVKTLAIQGTAEENMVARRNALQNSYDKLPKLIEEAGMRHFISNPKFIETPPSIVDVEFPLLDLPQVNLSQSVTLKLKKPKPERTVGPSPSPTKRRQVWLLDPMSGHDADAPPSEPALKKQRTIRFVV